MQVTDLTDEAGLDRILDENEIVVIDFWAPWCPPCRGFKPIFEAAAKKHTDIAFCRVNGDEAKQLADGFDVKSIPTTVAIRDRIMVASQTGFIPKEAFEELLQNVKSLSMSKLRQDLAAEAGEPPQ